MDTVMNCRESIKSEMRKERNNPNRLYKYIPSDYGLDVIRNKRLKVVTVSDANDPNEWLPVMLDPETGMDWNSLPEFRGQFRYKWSYSYGFISFSRKDRDLLMWGHYADKFRGMVLVFNVVDTSKTIEVTYSQKRFVLDKKVLKSPTEKDFENLIAQKDSAWEYEQEYRILVDLRVCTTKRMANGNTIYLSRFEPTLALSGVLLGPECTVTMEDILCAFAGRIPRDFSVIRLQSDSETYSLVSVPTIEF